MNIERKIRDRSTKRVIKQNENDMKWKNWKRWMFGTTYKRRGLIVVKYFCIVYMSMLMIMCLNEALTDGAYRPVCAITIPTLMTSTYELYRLKCSDVFK
jgi:hypothetical protein